MADEPKSLHETDDQVMTDVERPSTAETDAAVDNTSNNNETTTSNEEKANAAEDAVVEEATEKPDPSPGNSLSLPIARVKRIIKQDDEITACSTSAVYAIASATELFIKHFTEQALLRTKFEKRKKMSYNDFAEAVSSVSELQFLSSKYQMHEKPRATTTHL
jgi:histone H3/H4